MIDRNFRLAKDVRYRKIGADAVIIRQQANEVLVLNELGAIILEAIEKNTPVAAVIARINDDYDVDGETLAEDAGRYLQELVDAGVIESIQP